MAWRSNGSSPRFVPERAEALVNLVIPTQALEEFHARLEGGNKCRRSAAAQHVRARAACQITRKSVGAKARSRADGATPTNSEGSGTD